MNDNMPARMKAALERQQAVNHHHGDCECGNEDPSFASLLETMRGADMSAEEAAASPSQLLTPHSALAHSPTTPATFCPLGPVCPLPRCDAALDGRVRRALAGRAPRCGPALDGRVLPLL